MGLSQQTRKSLLAAGLASLAYMAFLWLLFAKADKTGRWFSLMSITFLFLAPFLNGALINSFAPPAERRRLANRLGWPILFSILPMVLALLIKIEGLICLVMASPIFMLMAFLGAYAYSLQARGTGSGPDGHGPGPKRLAVLLAIPLAGGPLEGLHRPAEKVSVTENRIEIAAPAAEVWQHIIRVPEIRKSEIPFGLSHLIGFPDPLEATLSHEGLGGVRRARFHGKVLFTETIDRWEPERFLAFSIEANTEDIPPETMDEHMIVGGKYFDVLRGEYEIVPVSAGHCLLKLRSTHSARTNFNLYTDAWGGLLMGDIQQRILAVIKARSERRAPTGNS